MTSSSELTDHYAEEEPIDRIVAQLALAGIGLDELTIDHLAGVDEFHLGGKLATSALLESVHLGRDDHHLDIGCGIGGAARAIWSEYWFSRWSGCGFGGVVGSDGGGCLVVERFV